MTYIQLTYSDLVLPALLVVMNGALSVVLHLKLERQLAVATARMVVQLVLVGYVLTFLFAAVSPLWTAVAAIIMVLFASRETVVRQKRRLQGLWTLVGFPALAVPCGNVDALPVGVQLVGVPHDDDLVLHTGALFIAEVAE